MILLQILFWCCVIFLLHSYLFYPAILGLLTLAKRKKAMRSDVVGQSPSVSILLAAHNEAVVIEEKLRTTLKTKYPLSNLELLVGSDASDDGTDDIVNQYASAHPNVKLIRFQERAGKIAIMNRLAEMAAGEILLLTDANVFFSEQTIGELLRQFQSPEIAIVAGTIHPTSERGDGVARQESFYQRYENDLKYREGILWGAMMGAFGGYYAVRKSFFHPTPQHFIVDDFYITLAALEKGGKAISEPSAICYEEVSELMKEEFRRKSRIGAGNFQVLGRFWRLLSPSHGGMAFAFLSHKVLRWLGPFFLIGAYLSSFVLAQQHVFYQACFWIQTVLYLISLLDVLLAKVKVQLPGLKYVSHFYLMNLALLNGFVKFITGIKHNVWKPTQRNQSNG